MLIYSSLYTLIMCNDRDILRGSCNMPNVFTHNKVHLQSQKSPVQWFVQNQSLSLSLSLRLSWSAIDYFWLDCWSCAAGMDCSVIWAPWSSPSCSLIVVRSRASTGDQKTTLQIHTNEEGTMIAWLWDIGSHGGLAPDNRLLFAAPSRFVIVVVVGSEQRETDGEMSRRQVLSAPKTSSSSQ